MNSVLTSLPINAAEMAKYIDHTLLKPDATFDGMDKLCEEAIKYRFKAVCVNSGSVAHVSGKLQGSGVDVCSVVGFPLGAMHTSAKSFEAEKAIEDGAQELDMVLNIGALKSGDLTTVDVDIRTVRQISKSPIVLKVIIEACLLTEKEKIRACEIAKKARRGFCQNQYRVQRRRGDYRGCGINAERCRPYHGGEGERRH